MIVAEAALKRGFLKKRMSSIGWSECSSHQAKAARNPSPIAKAASTGVDVQPLSGPSMRAKSRPKRPTIDRTEPMGSSLPSSGFFESGMRNQPEDQRGEAQRHVDEEDRAPPEVLEQQAAAERADGDAEAGDAGPDADGLRPLAGSVNTFVRIDSVVGKMQAPPMPMSARARIRPSAEPEKAATAENRAKSMTPRWSIRLRPNLSPMAPTVSSSEANTIVYESMIHCSCEPEASRSSTIFGSATFRIVLSTPITSSDRISTPRVHHRRSYSFCGSTRDSLTRSFVPGYQLSS